MATRSSPCLSTPAFAGWHREIISIATIPACSSGEEVWQLLGVTAPWFKQAWRQDEMMLKLPLGACAGLMQSQLEKSWVYTPGRWDLQDAGFPHPSKKIFMMGW